MKAIRAIDGKQAVQFFTDSFADTFDVILIDIMMPEMNGHLLKPSMMAEVVRISARNL